MPAGTSTAAAADPSLRKRVDTKVTVTTTTTSATATAPGSTPKKAFISTDAVDIEPLPVASTLQKTLLNPAVMIPALFAVLLSYLAFRSPVALANNNGGGASTGNAGGAPVAGPYDPLQPLTIYAYGINATFIPRGATITHLYVHDRQNVPRDVIVGYDDPADYPKDTATSHTYFGAIVGRYANRIKNGAFPLDGQTYNIAKNEHAGQNTLHGGVIGYDQLNWSVTSYNTSSITFSLYDPDMFEGFPGAVQNYVTYSLQANPPRLSTRIVSIALSANTPIMPSTHIYWNLGAFATPTVNDDTLWMPYSERTIDTDNIQIPTGGISSVKYPWTSPPVPLNFTAPKPIGDGSLYSKQCGTGCVGIDNAFIIDRPVTASSNDEVPTIIQWSSPATGIQMDMRTNMASVQVYACAAQNGKIPVKASQKANGVNFVEKDGCLVIEPQGWIDGINQPGWGQHEAQIFGPTTMPSVNWAEYTFSTI